MSGLGALALICAGLAAAWGIWRTARRTAAAAIEAQSREAERRLAEEAATVRASVADLPDGELDDLVFRRPRDREQ